MSKKTLQELRSEIAKLDAEILTCLHHRKTCVERIADIKHASRLPLRDLDVEHGVHTRNQALAEQFGLREGFIEALTKLFIGESLHWQGKWLEGRSISSCDVGNKEPHPQTETQQKDSSPQS